jgi:hypothetical protein
MNSKSMDLTGVWQGLYTYPSTLDPVFFVATIIMHGKAFSGTTHEAQIAQSGAPLTAFAMLEGTRDGTNITFTKSYDGTGGWNHALRYAGELSADGSEIEGEWFYPASWSGKFLMMRGTGASEQTTRSAFKARQKPKTKVGIAP